MGVQIKAITKPEGDERYEAISHYWANNKDGVLTPFERSWLISWLDTNNTYAFVSEDGDEAHCDIRDNGCIRYLQTRADASRANNLLSLPRK